MADEGLHGKSSQKTLRSSSKSELRDTIAVPQSDQAVACNVTGGFVWTSKKQRAPLKPTRRNNNNNTAGTSSTSQPSNVSTSSRAIASVDDASAGISGVTNENLDVENTSVQSESLEPAVPFFLDSDTKEEPNEKHTPERPGFLSGVEDEEKSSKTLPLERQFPHQAPKTSVISGAPDQSHRTTMPTVEGVNSSQTGRRGPESPVVTPNFNHYPSARPEVVPNIIPLNPSWNASGNFQLQHYPGHLANSRWSQATSPSQPHLTVAPYYTTPHSNNHLNAPYSTPTVAPFSLSSRANNGTAVSSISHLPQPPLVPTSASDTPKNNNKPSKSEKPKSHALAPVPAATSAPEPAPAPTPALKSASASATTSSPASAPAPAKTPPAGHPARSFHNRRNDTTHISTNSVKALNIYDFHQGNPVKQAELDGVPLFLESKRVCKDDCFESSNGQDHKKIRCVHDLIYRVECLSRYMPKEDPLNGRIIRTTESGEGVFETAPPGASSFIQAVQFSSGNTQCNWKIIPRQHTDILRRVLQREGKLLERGDCIPTPEQLEECKKAGLIIQEGVQRRGDIFYVPFGCWYQVTVTAGSVTMDNRQTFTIRSVYNAMRLDAYIFHRICNLGTPQVRRMIYYYLFNIHRNIIQEKDGSSQENLDKAEVGKALQLFDRLLIEDYTQGSPEHETRLLEPSSCDFCGADIFNAAFICSNTRALSDRILLPSECCEIIICPSCCVEGRSCLCGKLRLCVMHNFEELLSMRNAIHQWCGELVDLEQVISAQETINESDVYESTDHQHTTLGAIYLLTMRRRLELPLNVERPIELPLVVTCTGGELGCEEHDVGFIRAVMCEECDEAICFNHLLSAGVHSSEATFSQRIDGNWHYIHSEWSRKWHKWQSRPGHTIEDPHDQILAIAASVTTCKPLKAAHLRLGFYDEKDELGLCAEFDDMIPALNEADGSEAGDLVNGHSIPHSENDGKSSDIITADIPKQRRRKRKADSAFAPKGKKRTARGRPKQNKGRLNPLGGLVLLTDGDETMDDLTGIEDSREQSIEVKEEAMEVDMREVNTEHSIYGSTFGGETAPSTDEMEEADDVKYQMSIAPFSEGADVESWPATSPVKETASERLQETNMKLAKAEERIKSLQADNERLLEQVRVMEKQRKDAQPAQAAPVSPVAGPSNSGDSQARSVPQKAQSFDKKHYENMVNDLKGMNKKLEGILEDKNLEIIQLQREIETLRAENLPKERATSPQEDREEPQPSTPPTARDEETEESTEDSDHDSLDLLHGRYRG